MNPSRLVRNPDRVKRALTVTEDGRLIAREAVSLTIPCSFQEHSLAEIQAEVYTIGNLAIVLEDGNYAVLRVPAFIRLSPENINTYTWADEKYYDFAFEKGDVISPSLDLVKRDISTYDIHRRIVERANVPWYFDYFDLQKLFLLAKAHAGAGVAKQIEVYSAMVSRIAKNPDNLAQDYRHILTSPDVLRSKPPTYVPLPHVALQAEGTLNKLNGAYFDDGLNAAILRPATKVSPIEVPIIA